MEKIKYTNIAIDSTDIISLFWEKTNYIHTYRLKTQNLLERK